MNWSFRETLKANGMEDDICTAMSFARYTVSSTQKTSTIQQVLEWVEEHLYFSESTGCLYDVLYTNVSTQRQKARARALLKRQEKQEFERVMKKLKGVENE